MGKTMKLGLILTIALCIVSTFALAANNSYHGYSVVRVHVKNIVQRSQLSILGSDSNYDFLSQPRIGAVDIILKPTQISHFEKIMSSYDIEYKYKTKDLGRIIQEEDKVNAKRAAVMDWTSYHRIETIHQFLDDVAAEHPNLAEIISIGNSTENRDLKLIKIGNSKNETKLAIWIDGGIHAREWITPAVTTWIINQLLNNSAQYADLLNAFDFYIIPSTNPDGYEYSHETTRLWRKTRSLTTNKDCLGVDPNRNYIHGWSGPGSSDDPCSEIFRGYAPFSEPETRAMKDFIGKSVNVNWQLYLTIHSYSQVILSPWGYKYELPDDYKDLMVLAYAAAEAIKKVHGTEYEVGAVTEIFEPGSGGSDDWAKASGFKYSYTYELRDTGEHGFELPSDQIIPTSEETWAGIQAMAKVLLKVTNHKVQNNYASSLFASTTLVIATTIIKYMY